jgi:hypothetical protein
VIVAVLSLTGVKETAEELIHVGVSRLPHTLRRWLSVYLRASASASPSSLHTSTTGFFLWAPRSPEPFERDTR